MVLGKICHSKIMMFAKLGAIPLACGIRGLVKVDATVKWQLGIEFESKGTVTAPVTFEKLPNLIPVVNPGAVLVEAKPGGDLDWQ